MDPAKISLVEARTATKEDWESTYKDVEQAIHLVTTFLELDLKRFKQQSGKEKVALSSVRPKAQDSFVRKVLALAQDDKRLQRKYGDKKFLSVFDLATDLVGVRQVFYFERDIQEAVLYWMSYPVYVPIEVIDYSQDISGHDNDTHRWWCKQSKDKESGYESLHFIVRFDFDLLKARCENALKEHIEQNGLYFSRDEEIAVREILALRKKDAPAKVLTSLKFEVQCRTLLEHTWAEIEHRGKYSVVKAGKGLDTDEDVVKKKFRGYKAVLRAAQIFQNSLRPGFSRWDERREVITSRMTNVELPPRDHYWKSEPAAHEEILKINKLFKKAVEQSKSADLWNDVFAKIKSVVEIYLDGQLKLSSSDSEEVHGRKRLLVMYIAFILAYRPQKAAFSRTTREGKNSLDLADQRFLEGVSKYFHENHIGDGAKGILAEVDALHIVMPIRAYETVRILDEYQINKLPDMKSRWESVLFDPLVKARVASVYYRHFGSYRRSTQLYMEARDMAKTWHHLKARTTIMLSPAYLGKRIAENLWTAYNLEGHLEEDLSNALAEAKRAYREVCTMHPRKYATEEKRKILNIQQKLPSLILTMELIAACKQTGVKSVSHQREEDLWEVVARVESSIKAGLGPTFRSEFSNIFDAFNPAAEEGASLRQQGLAIWEILIANRISNLKRRNTKILSARYYIRSARLRIAEKIKGNIGGAVPFHEDIAREIEAFIYALSPSQNVLLRDSILPLENA